MELLTVRNDNRSLKVKEPSKNHDIWVQVLFGSLWVQFSSVLVHFFTFRFGLVLGKPRFTWKMAVKTEIERERLGLVLGKTWVVVWFILAGFGFFGSLLMTSLT